MATYMYPNCTFHMITKAYLIDVDMTLNPQWNTIETMFMSQFTSGVENMKMTHGCLRLLDN